MTLSFELPAPAGAQHRVACQASADLHMDTLRRSPVCVVHAPGARVCTHSLILGAARPSPQARVAADLAATTTKAVANSSSHKKEWQTFIQLAKKKKLPSGMAACALAARSRMPRAESPEPRAQSPACVHDCVCMRVSLCDCSMHVSLCVCDCAIVCWCDCMCRCVCVVCVCDCVCYSMRPQIFG